MSRSFFAGIIELQNVFREVNSMQFRGSLKLIQYYASFYFDQIPFINYIKLIMKKIMLILLAALGMVKGFTQKHVGIGTVTPLAALHVLDSSVLFSSPYTLPVVPADPPISGSGTRMMWYADKAAFRTGTVFSTDWNKDSIGLYSFAAGFNPKASGKASFSLGNNSIASGDYAVAMGYSSLAQGQYSIATCGGKASGFASVAIGDAVTASGDHALAMGEFSGASGSNSTAIGYASTASGTKSIAAGYAVIASGDNSTALGVGTTSSGDYSTAMGHNASTGNHRNAFCIAGAPADLAATNSTDNQIMMRFDNYTFWVSSVNYAYLIPASNGWAYTSDVTKKERFEELDGESVLQKIAKIPFCSWNFKAPDTRQYRHYGIMAQDFYEAFGKDDYGVIGNDTTVSPLDLLGVAYSGIKALEKRTENLQQQNSRMYSVNEQLQENNLSLQKEIAEIKKQFAKTNELLLRQLPALAAVKRKKRAAKKLPPVEK